MNIRFLIADPLQAEVDILGILCHDDTLDSDPLIVRTDAALGGLLRSAISEERFLGKPGQTVLMHSRGDVRPRRIALVGAGPSTQATVASHRIAAGRFARAAAAVGARAVALALPASTGAAVPPTLQIQSVTEGLLLGLYRFDKYLDPAKRTAPTIQAISVFGSTAVDQAPRRHRTRPGDCPRRRQRAQPGQRTGRLPHPPAAGRNRAACRGRSRPRAHRSRPRGLSAKGDGPLPRRRSGQRRKNRASSTSPGSPNAPEKRVVLVGKGVTFDSGGLSLKTNEGMLDMKVDMSGAAAVISAVESAARQKLPVEVHALAACTENMPSGTAYKLGDVLRSMAGKTVEITNTDAEGRLTLADAITYGLALKPDFILDFATLTGACVVALGPHIAGVMGNNDALTATWLAAAKNAGEEMWPLPLPPRLVDQLKSEIADLKNTGERWGGALTAGLFLKEFVDATPWLHVDLAGPASTDKELGHIAKGGTGFGVATILEFLRTVASPA